MNSAMQYFPTLSEEEIRTIVGEWKSFFPEMGVLVMLSESEKAGVSLLQGIFSEYGIPLTGGIFPELVVEGHFTRNGCWLLRFDIAPFYILQEALPSDAEGASRVADEIASALHSEIVAGEEGTLFLLFDAMVPNIGTLLDEFYLKLANRLHYAGANAGSETFQPMPCLFDNERITGNAMLALLIRKHHGAILEHGYKLPNHSATVTSTEGNRISHIDWKPAFEVYRELVKGQYGIEITPENFYNHAVHYPFGIIRANHNVLVRIPVSFGEDGSLFCVGEVPPHSVLALLEAPEAGSHHTVDMLVDRLSKLNGGSTESSLLLFYCAGRRMHLGAEAAEAEASDMRHRSGSKQMSGALSLGEIGASTLWGYPLFHNATLVAIPW